MNRRPRALGAVAVDWGVAADVGQISGSSSQTRSLVDAHAPHGHAFYPCSHASTSTRANVAGAVGLRPSASLEDAYVQAHRRTRVREDHPERKRRSLRETGRRRGDLRGRRRPAQRDETGRLCSLGTSRWGKNVTFPARQYSVNGGRRSFALLRPSTEDRSSQDAIRDCILDAYTRLEAAS